MVVLAACGVSFVRSFPDESFPNASTSLDQVTEDTQRFVEIAHSFEAQTLFD